MGNYLPPLTDNTRRWLRFIFTLLVIGLLSGLMLSLRGVFTPILTALAIAYILNPLVTWVQRRGVSRLVVIAVLYIAGIFVLLILGIFLVTTAVEQIIDLRESFGGHLETAKQWIVAHTPVTTQATETQPDTTALATWWQEFAPLAQEHGVSVANTMLTFLTGLLAGVLNWITIFVLIPMYSFFFLWKFNSIISTIHDHLPAQWRDNVVYLTTTIDRAIANFFRGRLLVCLIVGLLTGLGWTLVGVPYSLPLGALAGVLNLVPFMSLLALPLALVITYLDALQGDVNWVTPVLMTMGVYMLVQALESFVLTPTIESRSSGLHPITTVVALLIGAEWAGLLGMLLAIPIASTVKTFAVEYVLPEVQRLATPPPESPTEQEPDTDQKPIP